MTLVHAATAAFREVFGRSPEVVVRAPGRVNLIGEHTDYNDGFVLPLAIDRAVWAAAAPRRDRRVRLLALDLERTAEFELDGLEPNEELRWSNYARGVLAMLERGGHALSGLDLVYVGDVPIGAGLSSSAAVEVAVAATARLLFDLPLDPLALARLCQQAEHQFVGTQCGIMDQLVSLAGVKDHALLIDCRHLTWRPIPLPPGAAVVVLDTGRRRGLAGSIYNERRRECEEGARLLGVPALRDVSTSTLEREAARLPRLIEPRCRHIVAENERTLQAAEALRAGDAETVGRLMNESHTSLRDLFEVSCLELDVMAMLAQNQPGCLGARMTGAGFGGCAVALVEQEAIDTLIQAIGPVYERQTSLVPHLYPIQATTGAAPIPTP